MVQKSIRTQGFTLIELSIVILIIGLITGGLLIGRSMMRQSQVMSVIVEEQKYVKAALSFRDKYNALPGDMVNATSYWGADPNGCPNSLAYTTPQTATCNGVGSGYIEGDGINQSGSAAMFENLRAWQQLAAAGFIQGGYTGTPGPNSWADSEPGLNVPATKLANGGFEWYVMNGNGRFTTSTFPGTQNFTQYLIVATQPTLFPGFDLLGALFTAPEAYALDKKLDDGIPNTGVIIGGNDPHSYTCLNGGGTAYLSADVGASCTLLFQVKW